MSESAERRGDLFVAIKLCGGPSDVAERAGIDRTNLSRWLDGKPTLSAEKVDLALEAIGLIEDRPRSDCVHQWKVTHGFSDLTPGLRIYFPGGAKLKVAPWTVPGRQWSKIMSKNRLPEVFAISDGRVRAVLRAPSGVFGAVEKAVGHLLEWAGSAPTERLLEIDESDAHWLTPGSLTIEEFDAKFQMSRVWDLQDIGDLLTEKGITIEDAFGRISEW